MKCDIERKVKTGDVWRGKDKNGNFDILILAAMTDLNGRERIVFQRIKEPRYIGNSKVQEYQSPFVPKLVTPCYVICKFKLKSRISERDQNANDKNQNNQ